MNAAAKQSIRVVSKAQTAQTYSAMKIAVFISIAIHAIILTIHFQPELKKIADHLPSLSVVLVNAKTKTAPEKAEALAQANLDRGGNTDDNRTMKSALPAPKEKTTEVKLQPSAQQSSSAKSAKVKAQEAREQKHVDELTKQAQELITQINSMHKIESNPTQNAAAAQPEEGDQKTNTNMPDHAAIAAAMKEMDRLSALIDKQQSEYEKRPKRKFIGARTKEYRFALYVESWRQKVERIGNMNYPEAAKAQKLYGQLRMTVSIKADGSIEDVVIDKSSGSKILDEAARRIVELAAPYSQFPDDIKKDTDILSITRSWTFTQEDQVATE